MLWATVGMCCDNVPRPHDAFKCSTLGLLKMTVILTGTVSDKRPPSWLMCILVRHHRASRIPSLCTLHLDRVSPHPWWSNRFGQATSLSRWADKYQASPADQRRSVFAGKHEEFRSALATFFKAPSCWSAPVSRLVEQGAGGGEKSCTVQQISKDTSMLRALPHALLRNVLPKVGRGSGPGGWEALAWRRVWQQWVMRRNAQLRVPPLTPSLFNHLSSSVWA